MKTLEGTFLQALEEAYDAEVEIVKGLSKIIPQAVSTDLKEVLDNHSLETQNHIARLDEIEKILQITIGGDDYKSIRGLLQDGDRKIADADINTTDLVIISSAQKVEHFEISLYKTLVSYAKALKYKEIELLLEATLKEEITADNKLEKLLQPTINKLDKKHA